MTLRLIGQVSSINLYLEILLRLHNIDL